jgi:hypothetical protein
MQCSNCQFQNIPGVQTCGRCGASLQLASLAIDVHPPRASRAAKWLRRWFPTARYWRRIRSARVLSRIRISAWPADLQTPGVLLRMIVPGWAQRHLGRIGRARWIFWCYLGFLLSGLLFLGTLLGWLLMGMAIAVHVMSILDIVARGVVDFNQRLLHSAAAMFLLILIVYYPASRLLSLVAAPQLFNVAAPPFAAGDVVLVNPSAYRWSDPQPGDVVQYRLPPQNVRLQDPGHGARVYHLEGDRIDRILARAGQRVTCKDGKLLVDGQPSPWLPLGSSLLPEGLDVAVPASSYLIFPSTEGLAPGVAPAVSIVSREQIVGWAYWRNQPLWRFGPIR